MSRYGNRALLAVKPGDKRPSGRNIHSRAYKPGAGSAKLVEVYDLDFAAYCLLQGCDAADMQKAGSYPERYVFTFMGTPADVERLAVAFTNSEAARHADCVRRLKKSVRVTRPSQRPQVVHADLLYQGRADGTVDVYKLDFAAYCLLSGYKVQALLKSGGVKGQGAEQYTCVFAAADEDSTETTEHGIASLAHIYKESEAGQHAECVRRLKRSIRKQSGR